MSTIYVGLPVQQHTRRFHLEKGRRWNVVEHLIIQALAKGARTAGDLARAGLLSRRVVLEALIRLMRAGWVEMKVGTSEVTFNATARGRAVAFEDELPVVTQPVARKMNFAVDRITGSIFRRRDLTLLWPKEWVQRVAGHRSVEIAPSKTPPQDLGHVSTLLGAMLEEDERLTRVDVSDRRPADRIAMFIVRNGEIEGLPARYAPVLRALLLDAAAKASAANEPNPPVKIEAVRTSDLRPQRRTLLRQDDLILGGPAHSGLLTATLRRARQLVVIHSTFLSREKFDLLTPSIREASARGCRVEILWGQATSENGFVRSMQEARSIAVHLDALGLADSVCVHLSSTRSHAKVLIADDGHGAIHATIGSCNWLYSGFDSYEASVRLRDPRLVGDVLMEVAQLARPRDDQLPDLTVRLAGLAREVAKRPPLHGNSDVRLIIGEEHDDCLLEARDRAQRNITVMSHRLGVAAKPAVVIPAAAAVRERGIAVDLLYAIPSGPVEQAAAMAAQWDYVEQGVTLRATQRPRLHAKMLLWDEDEAVVTSLNWLSADATNRTPHGEMGLRISSARLANLLRDAYRHAEILDR